MISNDWWWYAPPAIAIALLGIGLALLNFGIDEIVNPRVRSSRGQHRGVRFRLGITPVVRTASPRRGRRGSAPNSTPGVMAPVLEGED